MQTQKVMTAEMAYRLISLRGLIPDAEQYETPELAELCAELKAHMEQVQKIQATIKALAEKAEQS